LWFNYPELYWRWSVRVGNGRDGIWHGMEFWVASDTDMRGWGLEAWVVDGDKVDKADQTTTGSDRV